MSAVAGGLPERRHLEAFLAVVDHGGFTAAAHRLGKTPSAVAQALRQLERVVGAELFIRSARPFRLTAAGRAAEPIARRALRDLGMFSSVASTDPDTLTGRLTICTLSTMSAQPVAQLVGAYRARYRGVRVDITAPHTHSVTEVLVAVRTRHADIGITEFPVETRGLRAIEFDRQEFVAVLPPGTGREGRPITAAEFAAIGILVGPFFKTSTAYPLLESAFRGISDHITAIADHRPSLIHLVAEGVGATLVHGQQALVARQLGCETVHFEPALYRRAGLVHPGEDLSPTAAAFVRLCQEPPFRAATAPPPVRPGRPPR